ncbi:LolA-like outer membrane lipoprotein chaperone [Sulfurovum sp. ST-21]|uniref:Outer-membrane lipoprotein carrier protein LolA n=1 Tax=Sulfurovum indicum TaxID=2779528 RepID=A0A7M1S791_9BACT|nr:LolA-like outer membrane lipoprotein chaperone [Sulfurovum indicum]QOR62579.1 outer-membrane lipoprotein carrier protein LolA [Sulfurovum indicum]
MRLLTGLMIISGLFAGDIILPEHFTAGFAQTITNPKNKVIRYSGKVAFSHENFLKWTYLKPTKKEVCTDGKEVLVVDHDLEQTSAYRINKGFDLTQIIKEAKPYKDDIYVTEYAGKRYTIRLDSKGRLQSVAYYDDLDNKVQILFTGMRYGKGVLPAEVMKCNYPASYDVIRG